MSDTTSPSAENSCTACTSSSIFGGSPAWNMILGCAMLLIGLVAITRPFPAGIGIELGIAALLCVSAIFQLIAAFQAKSKAIIWHIAAFLLYAVIAWFFYKFGMFTLEIITLVIGLSLIVLGVARSSLALSLRRSKGWGWALVNALVTIALGCIITFNWPDSSIWTLGTLIGVNLLFEGMALITLALNQFRPTK